jgi:DNA mismatch repair ATPase MutS
MQLAQAILEDLSKDNTKLILFATHFFELTKLKLQNPLISNLYLETIEND